MKYAMILGMALICAGISNAQVLVRYEYQDVVHIPHGVMVIRGVGYCMLPPPPPMIVYSQMPTYSGPGYGYGSGYSSKPLSFGSTSSGQDNDDSTTKANDNKPLKEFKYSMSIGDNGSGRKR